MTDEYIKKSDIKKAMHSKYADDMRKYPELITWLKSAVDIVISEIPAAEVQPINRWISVNDKLPEPEKDVLIWYRETWGAGFTSYRFGISRWFSKRKRWYEGCLPKDFEVLFWHPLPEPPKGGDTDG